VPVPAALAAGALAAHVLFWFGGGAWPLAIILSAYAAFRKALWPLAMAIAILCVCAQLQLALSDRLDPALNGRQITLEGRIVGLPEVHPDYTRLRFVPEPGSAPQRVPRRILLYWYRDAPSIQTGETWRVDVELKPPWGRVNFSGNDREMWLFSQGLGAQGVVRGGEKLRDASAAWLDWHAWRQRIGKSIGEAVDDEVERSIVTALAIADQSGLSTQGRETLWRTGTSHLLAISGLNIGLAAMFGFWLMRFAMLPIPLRWLAGRGYAACLIGGLLLALLYAGLAGFGASVLRAVIMLIVVVGALLFPRTLHPATALVWALAVVLLIDPLAALGAGLWLSFAAVSVLLFLVSGRVAEANLRLGSLFRAQFGIMLVLLPMSAWWFQLVSVSGLLANLLAVPWVSFVVVPLTLLGMLLLPLSETLAGFLFLAAGQTSGWLFRVLEWFASLPFSAFDLPQPGLWQAVLATLGGVWLLLGAGLRQRWIGALLFLPLFVTELPPARGALRIDVLDVGQGTAVMVASENHLLLYDSGPGNGEDFDLVQQVVVPAVKRSGHRAPSRILISHGDLDHAGGMESLRRVFPRGVMDASLPLPLAGVGSCEQGMRWSWDGIAFKVLHPAPHLPYLGNDSSCVLSIRRGQATVLLPGDISAVVEEHLLRKGLESHAVLLVPHHGSKSSSTPAFIDAISPTLAVATTGAGNRFDFPRPEVRKRFDAAGIPMWATGECGAIRLLLASDGRIEAQSARRARAAPWRWPVAGNCP